MSLAVLQASASMENCNVAAADERRDAARLLGAQIACCAWTYSSFGLWGLLTLGSWANSLPCSGWVRRRARCAAARGRHGCCAWVRALSVGIVSVVCSTWHQQHSPHVCVRWGAASPSRRRCCTCCGRREWHPQCGPILCDPFVNHAPGPLWRQGLKVSTSCSQVV